MLVFVSWSGHVFSMGVESNFGSKGGVSLEHHSSVAVDMILIVGRFCSGMAYASDFGNSCDCS